MKVEDLQTAGHFYFRFLSWSQTLKHALATTPLNPSETQLLEEVAVHDMANNTLSVRDAIGLSHLGSPATLHKRLHRLRILGLLTAERRGDDHQTKYLVPTSLALMHFESRGEAMHKAMLDASPPA